mmetsp:Transcript_36871/g.91076  ORF Transcript_36871/g.91076 Transcript_36871/m.91076 type:complete len:324 (-) Transcript_36871:58-1029(-)
MLDTLAVVLHVGGGVGGSRLVVGALERAALAAPGVAAGEALVVGDHAALLQLVRLSLGAVPPRLLPLHVDGAVVRVGAAAIDVVPVEVQHVSAWLAPRLEVVGVAVGSAGVHGRSVAELGRGVCGGAGGPRDAAPLGDVDVHGGAALLELGAVRATSVSPGGARHGGGLDRVSARRLAPVRGAGRRVALGIRADELVKHARLSQRHHLVNLLRAGALEGRGTGGAGGSGSELGGFVEGDDVGRGGGGASSTGSAGTASDGDSPLCVGAADSTQRGGDRARGVFVRVTQLTARGAPRRRALVVAVAAHAARRRATRPGRGYRDG